MAILLEEEIWEEGIYQYELTDPVQGGPNGMDNVQGKQLANRTKWLKAAIDAITGVGFIAAKANKLATPKKINGVNFDGSADIVLPGQTTISGNAGTATKLQTARKINGVDFDGSADIDIPSIVAGSIIYVAKNTAPSGYLKANGSNISRATYAALFAEIGTTFGAGNGSTTFNLPDLRGEFIRGWDDARGIDGGRAFGSWQTDELKSHSHSLFSVNGAGGGNAAFGSGYIFNTFSVSSTGGAETRPRNIALLACIKY